MDLGGNGQPLCDDNPYEQKLYSMFCGYDKEQRGWLSVNALQQLCKTLELKENGTKLIAALKERCGGNGGVRVTFKEFKEELLHVLGTEVCESPQAMADRSSTTAARETNKERVYIKEDPASGETATSHRSRSTKTMSPTREVAPKLVMGAKKYGRRSRPQTTDRLSSQSSGDEEGEQRDSEEDVISDSDADEEQQIEGQGTNKVQRSASQADVKRRRQPQTSSKLKRCASLPARRNMAREFVRIRGSSPNKNVKAQLESSVESLDASGYASASSVDYQIVPSEVIVDMWETAGIPNATQLLKYDLGFEGDQINIHQLSTAIDEELNGLRNDCPQDEQISKRLLRAALALNKAELNGLQVALKHLGEENQKLHASNRDANDRVAMMAQEVDERHATIEKSTQLEIRALEQKHSDSVRELAKQLEQDREHWAGVNVALEARIKHLETEEQKLRTENGRLEERNANLEAEQVQHQKQLSELLETNIRLNTEVCELEELQNKAEFNRTDRENEEIMELIEKITRLQMENTDLRDRNDELCAELDGLAGELNAFKLRKSGNGIYSKTTGNLEVNSESEDGEQVSLGTSPGGLAGSNSIATKRRGDSPSKIAEESPRLGKVRKCSTDTINSDGGNNVDQGSSEWVPLNAELESQTLSSVATDEKLISDLRKRVVELEKLLKDFGEQKTGKEVASKDESDHGETEKKNKSEDEKCLNCQDMESTLELMRKEFDNLEDYWQGKLNEERVLFEEEQRVNDDKFNDLLQKMLEYEEQFASTMKKEDEKRLSPIQERGCLEQQYLDLEQELEELKVQHKRMVKEKNEEIKSLRADVKNMQLPSMVAADPFNVSIDQTSPPESPASSPINYLWSQSTIQAPARDYQNPNWAKKEPQTPNVSALSTTTWTTEDVLEAPIVIAPIQKPKPGSLSKDNLENCDRVSVASSTDRHSTATYNVAQARDETGTLLLDDQARDVIEAVDAEELSQQQMLLRQLHADCKELSHKRDALLNELQQLNEVRPALEKNFAKTVHPSLTSRIQQLEQRNRQLQTLLKQHQQYSESIMHQTWQQQRMEIGELRSRLESQSLTVADQVQRLAKADILVKELFVENSHLRANIQRLEQQTMRTNYMFQQHSGGPPGMNGVPSFP